MCIRGIFFTIVSNESLSLFHNQAFVYELRKLLLQSKKGKRNRVECNMTEFFN